jgi:hypothetical protein
MMRKCHVRFGGGRMEKVRVGTLTGRRTWNLASRLPYVIWGFQHLASFRRRHVGTSIEIECEMSLDAITAALNADTSADRNLLHRAATRELGPSREAVIEAVTKRGELSQKQANEAYVLAETYESNPRSIWGFVQGLTRLSQRSPWQDQRFAVDRAASRLLTLVR